MKSIVYIICLYLFCIFGTNASPSIAEYPYFASIEESGNHVCSATIIDDFYVMTTNSCVGALDFRKMRVRVGTDKLGFRGGVFKVVDVFGYTKYDAALVKVGSPFSFNSRVMPINPNNNYIQEGQSGILVGWANNKKKSSPLSPSPVTVLPSATCSAVYAGVLNLTSNMFCLSPTDPAKPTCLERIKEKMSSKDPRLTYLRESFEVHVRSSTQADIGAPFYYNEQYYGLVVYNPGCKDKDLPVVVNEVSPYTPFILMVLIELQTGH